MEDKPISGDLNHQIGLGIRNAINGEKSLIPYPLASMRKTMVGVERAEATMIGGRPGHAKTSFAIWLIVKWVLAGYKVIVISREMQAYRLIHKMITMFSDITSRDIRIGKFTEKQLKTLQETGEQLLTSFDSKLWIYDDKFYARDVQLLVERHKPDVVLEDFIQLTDYDESKAHSELKRILWGHIKLAKKYNHAHVALSQLNQGVERRDNPIPRTSDLAESDKLGQLASQVIMLYYAHKIDPRTNPKDRIKVVSTKSRFGETGWIDLHFDGDHMNFKDLPTKPPKNRRPA